MKKKGMYLLLVAIVLAFGLTACGKQKKEDDTTVKQEEQQSAVNQAEEKTDEVQNDGAAADEVPETTETAGVSENTPTASVTVYYSNTDATAFDQEVVNIASLSPESILAELVKKGVLSADIKINSFTELEKDGKKVIDLDFSKEFGTFITSRGSTGEYYTVGSICNTFLTAYGCESIHITVDGQMLATGHAEYPGYMTKFE